MTLSKLSKLSKPPFDTPTVKTVTPYRGAVDSDSDQTAPRCQNLLTATAAMSEARQRLSGLTAFPEGKGAYGNSLCKSLWCRLPGSPLEKGRRSDLATE